MIIAQARFPVRPQLSHVRAKSAAHGELNGMPLAIIEADGLDAREALERPSETNGRILSAGKENESFVSAKGHRCFVASIPLW
jgi:predicted carbohydrate-binding protein with CBM5 and CBM33 domain